MENTLELRLAIPEVYQDSVIAELLELGFQGFEQRPESLHIFIAESEFTNELKSACFEALEEFGDVDDLVGEIIIHEPQNWNETFEKSIKPITVGSFFIYPTWSEEDCPEDKIPIIIDPKMSFGTGYHETTQLMLHALTEIELTEKTILDVGTGTGILAIAAIKLGAKQSFGFDIDEWSAINAQENAIQNGVIDSFTIAQGGFETLENKSSSFDIVIANINRSVLLGLKQELVNSVSPNGYLLVSGILTTEADWIRNDEQFSTLQVIQDKQLGDWTGLVFKKI